MHRVMQFLLHALGTYSIKDSATSPVQHIVQHNICIVLTLKNARYLVYMLVFHSVNRLVITVSPLKDPRHVQVHHQPPYVPASAAYHKHIFLACHLSKLSWN